MKKTAVITGASGAIGSETALALAKEGYQLLLCGHSSKEKLEETRDRCLRHTSSCLTICGDIGDSHTAKNIADTALQQFGHIDEWFQLMNTNLSSAFFLCRQILPAMIHEKAGRILNISSIWGCVGASCETVYSASKGGLNAFTKALAKELAPSGIAVNAVSCGMIDTKMNACLTEEEIESICLEIPIGRMASPKETAAFIALLLKAPVYMTGQVIGFDGGW